MKATNKSQLACTIISMQMRIPFVSATRLEKASQDYSPYGYAMESRIQVQYLIDYPGNSPQFGTATGLGANPRLKPDIFDQTRKIWMDIKPMSFAESRMQWRLGTSTTETSLHLDMTEILFGGRPIRTRSDMTESSSLS